MVKEKVALRIIDHSSKEEINRCACRNSHQFILRLRRFTTTAFTHFFDYDGAWTSLNGNCHYTNCIQSALSR
jgi:hypothetical protein